MAQSVRLFLLIIMQPIFNKNKMFPLLEEIKTNVAFGICLWTHKVYKW